MNLEDGEYCVTIDEDFTQNTYSGDTGYAGFVILEDGTFVMDSYGHWDEDFSKSWTGGVTTDLCYIRQARFKLADLEAILFGETCVNGHTEEVIPATEPTFDAPGLSEGKKCAVCGEILEAQQIIPALDYNEGIVPIPVLTATAGDWQTGYEATEGPAELVLVDDFSTIWHTDWHGTSRENHWIQFELSEAYIVDGLRLKPRSGGGTNGIITKYDIQVSNDGVTFTSVASGNWAGDSTWKVVEFEGQSVKFVRLVALDGITDQAYVFASAAEIRLTGYKSGETPVCEHKNTETRNAKDATCTEAGYTGDTYCADCDEKLAEGKVIAAKGHNEVVVPGKDATCTETGLTEGKKCAECDEILVAQEEIPALGHEWKGLECTRCDAKRVNPFTDVPEGIFYFDPVLWAVGKGITTGATETTFNPDGQCTRAEVVTFLWRAAGFPEPTTTENPFDDVKETDFFYKAVLWANEKNITNGLDADTFCPFTLCNRAQVVTFLWRAMGEPASDAAVSFTDVQAGQFYSTAVAWAVEHNITNGISATEFGVGGICNRAQGVTFLYRTYVK